MIVLSWNNPIVWLLGRVRVRRSLTCRWCNEGFKQELALKDTPGIFCSKDCQHAFRKARRVALGLRESGPAVAAAVETPKQLAAKHSPKSKKLVSQYAVGSYENDELAKRYNIPRLAKNMRMPVGYDCHYCGKDKGGVTRDHIVADSRGGSHMWFNLVPSCEKCQNLKGNGEGPCKCLYCLRSRKVHADARKAYLLTR